MLSSRVLLSSCLLVGGGWSWNLTHTPQKEPSGKEGTEASLGAREPRDWPRPLKFHSCQRKTEPKTSDGQELRAYALFLLAGPKGRREGALQGTRLTGEVNQ